MDPGVYAVAWTLVFYELFTSWQGEQKGRTEACVGSIMYLHQSLLLPPILFHHLPAKIAWLTSLWLPAACPKSPITLSQHDSWHCQSLWDQQSLALLHDSYWQMQQECQGGLKESSVVVLVLRWTARANVPKGSHFHEKEPVRFLEAAYCGNEWENTNCEKKNSFSSAFIPQQSKQTSVSECVEVPPHQVSKQFYSGHKVGILQCNSIPTLSIWRLPQIP